MAKQQGKNGDHKDDVVRALPAACMNELAAVEFLEAQLWGGKPVCPHCKDGFVYQMRDRKTGGRNKRFLWRCKHKHCAKQFTVRVGTVFEDSKIPLRHWCYAFWAACASKKGVSALQIKRQCGLSYESALFMMHRIRFAMADDPGTPPIKLEGVVECDETYVGGVARNTKDGATKWENKTPVFALVQRNGDVRAMPVQRVTSAALGSILREHVSRDAQIVTDESSAYKGTASWFRGGHDTVNHSAKEYARGNIHTNTVEGFFSLLKRGVMGTFHSVSRHHLHRYVSEFSFRYNTRKLGDGQRVTLALQKGQGKRLVYQTPT